jgi:hypothetical protein
MNERQERVSIVAIVALVALATIAVGGYFKGRLSPDGGVDLRLAPKSPTTQPGESNALRATLGKDG